MHLLTCAAALSAVPVTLDRASRAGGREVANGFGAQCDTSLNCVCGKTGPGEVCFVSCTSENNNCYAMSLRCLGRCVVECKRESGLSLCTGLSLDCVSGDCLLLCGGLYSCASAHLACPREPGACGVACQAYGSCSGMTASGAAVSSCGQSQACSTAMQSLDNGSCRRRPPAGTGGSTHRCRPPIPSGSDCTVECASGYAGGGNAYCVGGTWISAGSSCVPPDVADSCGSPPTPSGFRVSCTGTEPYPPGATCTATCPAGESGGGTYTCMDKHWVAAVQQCRSKVQACTTMPRSDGAAVVDCTVPAESGSVCPVRCPQGYVGGGGFVCADGAWVDASTPCKKSGSQNTDCGAAPTLPAGSRLGACPLPATSGAVCAVTCTQAGNVTGQSSVVCVEGDWQMGSNACGEQQQTLLVPLLGPLPALEVWVVGAGLAMIPLLAVTCCLCRRPRDASIDTLLSSSEDSEEASPKGPAKVFNPLMTEQTKPRRGLMMRDLSTAVNEPPKPSPYSQLSPLGGGVSPMVHTSKPLIGGSDAESYATFAAPPGGTKRGRPKQNPFAVTDHTEPAAPAEEPSPGRRRLRDQLASIKTPTKGMLPLPLPAVPVLPKEERERLAEEAEVPEVALRKDGSFYARLRGVEAKLESTQTVPMDADSDPGGEDPAGQNVTDQSVFREKTVAQPAAGRGRRQAAKSPVPRRKK